MRIGMMADLYWPHVSGITNYISLNKRFLEAYGHEVFVFTFGGLGYQDQEKNIIRSSGIPLGRTGFFFSLQYNRRAREILSTMDVVHVHHPFTSGSLALRYCRTKNIPIIFTNHTRYDLYLHAYMPGIAETIGLAGIRSYLPPFCRAIDLVISPSAGMKEVLQSFGVDAPIDVVPNGVDLKPFHTAAPISRDRLGFRPDDVLLIYVGRLGPEKNLPFLLKVFAGITKKIKNVGLVLVGDGPERPALEEFVQREGLSQRVHFTGMVNYQEIPGYLASADIFATASVSEVHPLTLIEAMATGLPVIGIRSPGVRDLVEDGVTGLLAPEPDPAAFEDRMLFLCLDTNRRKAMSQRARTSTEPYAIEQTIQLILDRYERVILQASQREKYGSPLQGRFFSGPNE